MIVICGEQKKPWMVPLVVGVILALGAYLRLHNIAGYMTFLGDEGRDVLVVKRMIVDHKFTLLGPTASVGGFFLGPLYYYLMLPFLWAWGLNPVGPAVMVALFGVATIYLVYLTGRVLFDRWVGIIAASLYAVSPLVIAYSRSSWNPNVVPFFATLLVLLLWKLKQRETGRVALGIGVVLGMGLQLHYLFLFLFVLVGLWYAVSVRRATLLRLVALTTAGFVIGYAPFLAFEVRHGFPNTQSVIRFVFAGKETGYQGTAFFTTIYDIVFRLFGRLLFRLPDTTVWDNFPRWQIAVWIMITRTTAIISSIALFLPVFRRRKQSQNYLLLLLWFTVPVFLFGFYKKGIYDYYFGIFFALPFLAVGIIVSLLMKGKLSRWMALGLWLGLVYFNWQGRPFVHPPNNQLAQAREIARVAYEKAEGRPYNFALVTSGNSDHAYRYFFELWGNKPVTIENESIDPERKTVTDQLIVICEGACEPLGHPLWEIAGFGRAEIAGSWDVPFVKIYKLVHYKGES